LIKGIVLNSLSSTCRLYGDDALDNALNTYVKLLLSIPQTDLLDYPKLSQTYYVLLECLAQDHISFLATMEPQVFMYILSSISEGLTALGTTNCLNSIITNESIRLDVTTFGNSSLKKFQNNLSLLLTFCFLIQGASLNYFTGIWHTTWLKMTSNLLFLPL